MATDPGTIDFLIDQLGRGPASYSAKRMFGEYCLYRDGVPVALVCDDVLFVKDTGAGRDAMPTLHALELGAPYPGAKAHLRLPPDAWDDGAALRRLLDATAAALPPPKPKRPREAMTPRTVGKKTAAADAATKPARPAKPRSRRKTPD